MAEAVLALDQGTSGSTARVFGRDGRVRGGAYSEFTQFYPQPGWVEHDAEEIWRVSRRVMAEALTRAGLRPGELRAVGLTNQRETTVVWERAGGRPLQRALVWQSRQSVEICARLRAAGHEPLLRERTGLLLDPYFSGSKLAWLLDRHDPERRRARAGELLFGTIDTWLLWQLTRGAVHATEPTNASRTLLFDVHKRAWDDELLALFGVPRAMLPDVRGSASVFALVDGRAFEDEGREVAALVHDVPIAGIAGDQQAALFGQGCFEAGQAKNTYGTGAFVALHTGAVPARSRSGLLTTLCCDASGGVAYALEGSIFVAGAAVQWLRDELELIRGAAETEALARSVPDSAGVYVVPAFTGLGAPWWDAEARGAIFGLTRGANRRHLVRATLESLAYQTRDVIEAMNRDSGVPLRELRVDGGAAANDFLMQFQADMLGVPVQRPASIETTVAGAAHLAGLTTGVWRDATALNHVRQSERTFTPTMPQPERARLYAGWQEAVARVTKTSRA